jgi:hypothetical protein
VEEALLKWLKQKRSENVLVSGPLLMSKAEELSKLLNDKDSCALLVGSTDLSCVITFAVEK